MATTTYVIFTLFIILLLSYWISAKFRYYFKFGIYIFILAAGSIILIPLAAIRPKNVKNLNILAILGPIISPIIGVEWMVKGEEYLSKDESYIIMANHQSYIDALGMFHLWPIMQKGTAVAKDELKYAGPFGLLLWLSGVLFIPRSKGENARKILNRELQTRKKNKIKLWIFPEGTRRSDGKIHNFKKGGFHMALNAKIPILPVVFSYYSFLEHEKKHFHRGKVVITVLPPVYTEGRSFDMMDDLISEVQGKMIRTFEEISSETLEIC